MEGGSGQDLIQGDHGAPFFDDPAQVAPGNEVMIGQVGENDYDAEGGDDLMAQNAAIDRNAGAAGFDWAFHQYNTQPADDDMEINNNLVGVPIQVVVNRDRWQETEADSGSRFDDIIRGHEDAPNTLGGAGFAGCDVIDQAGVDRIAGLDAIMPPLTESAATVIANSAAGFCPVNGPVFGAGDILLGGGGSDSITGRGADDIIDGDRELTTRISVLDHITGTEIASTDLMEHSALSGTFPGLPNTTLQQAVFAGDVDPGDLRIVREILTPGANTDTDTAVFRNPLNTYTITHNANGSITVDNQGGTDGVDTLWNIEQLQFSDTTIPAVQAPTNTPATGTVTISDTTPAAGEALAVSASLVDADGVNMSTVRFNWQRETTTGVWESVTRRCRRRLVHPGQRGSGTAPPRRRHLPRHGGQRRDHHLGSDRPRDSTAHAAGRTGQSGSSRGAARTAQRHGHRRKHSHHRPGHEPGASRLGRLLGLGQGAGALRLRSAGHQVPRHEDDREGP